MIPEIVVMIQQKVRKKKRPVLMFIFSTVNQKSRDKPSRHTTLFQRRYDVVRRRIDVETTSCVYWEITCGHYKA